MTPNADYGAWHHDNVSDPVCPVDHGVGYEGVHGLGCDHDGWCVCTLEDCDEEACAHCRELPPDAPCPMDLDCRGWGHDISPNDGSRA
jgi:hypothetical protein